MHKLIARGGGMLLTVGLAGTLAVGNVAPADAASMRSRIVSTARSQIGYRETTGNCNKYTGTCVAWCARFTQWVYWKVGHAYTNDLSVPSVWQWAAKRKKTYRGLSSAKSGDLVMWKSKSHIGVVTKVSGGKLRVTSGNAPDRVAEHWYKRSTFYGGIRP
jgi:uncharacterized protein YijF (DUF1287 family)